MNWPICPNANLVTQGYGCTLVETEWVDPRCRSGRFHSGIDLGRTDGGWNLYRKPVYATRAGRVVKVGAITAPGYRVDPAVVTYFGDRCVTVRLDDGRFAMYGHLDQANCTVGSPVIPGDLLGLVGTKGNSSAPHLHFEIRGDGPYQPGPEPTVDPANCLEYVLPPEEDAMNLFRSSEKGPDGNPKVYVLEHGSRRHLTGVEYGLWVKAGAKITDVDASELTPLPEASGVVQGNVTGILTIS